jgi:NAD(P)H-nitrite reductase large subunit
MKENYTVCNCAQVDYNTIATAVETHTKIENLSDVFKDVQNVTHCSTGCGGCYQKVLDIISEILMG